MEIALYQIDPERDRNGMMFMPCGPRVDAGIYEKVFEGNVPAQDLEDVYRIFNLEKPAGFAGRSMAVSDVVAVRGAERGQDGTFSSSYFYCDAIGFSKIDFDEDRAHREERSEIEVIYCEPGKIARAERIGTDLEDLQEAVGGLIETYYPFDEEVCIVCNDEGKLIGMDPCRAVYDGDRRVRDIIFGPFFICGCAGENFESLTPQQMEKYERLFRYPEHYVRLSGEIFAVPYLPAEKTQEER